MDPLVRNLALAEMFSQTPLEIEESDADRWLVYMQVISIRSDFNQMAEGVSRDEPVYREGDV